MPLENVICPACGSQCKLSFQICDDAKTDWVFCKCSSIFQEKKTDKAHFDEAYFKRYTDYKALPDRCDYVMRLYLPIIRELTYGRHFLDVGYCFDHYIKALDADGWITDGIDLLNKGYIFGDFEKFDFKGRRYDFIHMGRVLESFQEPIRALVKAKEMLSRDGVLLIVTPDAELVYEKGMFEFGNWNPNDKWIIFGEDQLKKILATLGFKIILSRKDTERRAVGWNHVHMLVQKAA